MITAVIKLFKDLNYRIDLQYFIRRYRAGSVSIDEMPGNIAYVFRQMENARALFLLRISGEYPRYFSGVKLEDAQRTLTCNIVKQQITIKSTEVGLLAPVVINCSIDVKV